MLNFDIKKEKDKIINLYIKENKSSTEISKIYNISSSCIVDNLKK